MTHTYQFLPKPGLLLPTTGWAASLSSGLAIGLQDPPARPLHPGARVPFAAPVME